MTEMRNRTGRQADRKARLVCPDCGREGSMDDEWPIVRYDDRTEVECPECGSVIVSQPQFDSEGRRIPLTA